jgi:hypothetical protein
LITVVSVVVYNTVSAVERTVADRFGVGLNR